ncbi:sensor domain-containing diguanylate cyclase [Vibrio sp. 03-59-1]|uniref:diguanylate cyclase n=1 Tax=Vibrio sp. 03-59-1 TaxID=2607607 RepID=UPI001493335C|nr:diguanylate cyclase [Vibrio sp. 03-59-1]NOH82658.1 sensor domain-containing diguanylate cyclase [Vibrio sp. 03-59-1]
MRYLFGKQWSVNLLLAVFVIVAIMLLELLNQNQMMFLDKQYQSSAKEELSKVRSNLEAAIVADIYVSNSLSTLVSIHSDTAFDNWEKVAAKIIKESKHVTIIALARNDIINFVYPLQGNEKVIDLNYRRIPAQYASIVKAREIEQIFIAGPVNLVQGGRGLIARVPIFTDPPNNKEYWGVCSAVIDLDSLFQEVGIEAFELKYRLGIRGLDSSGSQGEIFYGDQTVFDDAFATEKVNFPYGSWEVAVARAPWSAERENWFRIHSVRLIGYPIIIILAFAFITIYRLYVSAQNRSLHDELTKLPNRRYFMYILEDQFNSAKKTENHERFALLNLDLDKFKEINDTYGHVAGDKVLVACAERVRNVLRSSDLTARIGGDEFLVLLPRVMSASDVRRIEVTVQKSLSSTPIIYEGALIYIKVSIGSVLYSDEFSTMDEMLKFADDRMYDQKQGLLGG